MAMQNSNSTSIATPSSRSAVLKGALGALGLALAFGMASVPALRADSTVVRPLDDKVAALPVTYTFDKSADPEAGPYILSLKNTATSPVTVSVKVLLSVYFHADSKARILPDHTIDPGQTWTVPGLAANDKVSVSSKEYTTLELIVP